VRTSARERAHFQQSPARKDRIRCRTRRSRTCTGLDKSIYLPEEVLLAAEVVSPEPEERDRVPFAIDIPLTVPTR